MHGKANRHPTVFGAQRKFRLTGQDLDLIFDRKVTRPILGVDKQLPHHFRRRVHVNVVERVDRRGLRVKWERPNYVVIHLRPSLLKVRESFALIELDEVLERAVTERGTEGASRHPDEVAQESAVLIV